MAEENRKNQKKIQAWVSNSMWDQIESIGYTSQTIAVTRAFEKLLEESSKDPIGSHEIPVLTARLEELERHIETLKGEITQLTKNNEDLKTIHNNYMLQVQTIINQKAIEAPGAKRPWWRFW